MIDVHCHITGEEFGASGGVQGLLSRAKEEGVARIIASGYDIPTSFLSMRFSESHDEIYFCAGFHPSELKKYKDGDLERLKTLCRHKKCVAVGEIGLDYHFEDNPPKEFQKEMFVKQLMLADELSLPVVIHSRDACQDTLAILKEHKDLLKHGGVMHCYSYSAESVEEFLNLGFYFSFGGPCTFKNAKKVWESVRRVPVSRILTETDCPYLTPAPYRGVFPNEPKNIKYIVGRMAELYEINEKEVEKRVEENAKRLFSKLD